MALPSPARMIPRGLLRADQTEVAADWVVMSDEALLQAIEDYRQSLRVVKAKLESLDVPVRLDEDDAAAPSGEDDGLGVEGVDYRVASAEDIDPREWQVPPHCVPIHANVTTYDWSALAAATQFDVIMMDPPWQLATANPTRGVALGYSQLTDRDIQDLPIPRLQSAGLLLVWVINAKFQFVLDLFERWGYELVDEVVWVKTTVNRRFAKSHGFYLQHAKEVCLVGRRGGGPPGARAGVCSDVILSERRGQSQKPEEIYELVEALVPDGRYLEIFGRKNNLRDYWVTVGNEITGKGPPVEDQEAVEAGGAIPGAVYGAAAR